MLQSWLKRKKAAPNRGGKVKRHVNLVAKLDRVFALYIRLRDVMPSGYGKCISCGQIKPFRELDCGHYWGRARMSTRFDERNCNAECRFCNSYSSDHLIKYRDNLVAKIGIGEYNSLEMLARSTKHWLDFELQEKIEHYTSEVKRLSKAKGIDVHI